MVKSVIDKNKYITLVTEMKCQLYELGDSLFSAIIYGSFSRYELYSKYSDIDLLCIISNTIFEKKLAKALNDIVLKNFIKFGIKIHLRIRNLSDLTTGASGIIDCGLTSSINKLRDGVLLYGSSIDMYYLDYILQSSTDNYTNNLKNRLSDLNYQNRALVSMVSNYTNETEYHEILKYKCGSILFQLAELTCYVFGIHFTSSTDAITKARKITDNKIFDKSIYLKSGLLEIDLPSYIDTVDRIILDNSKAITPRNYNQLRKIKVCNFSELSCGTIVQNVIKQIEGKYPLKSISSYLKGSVIEKGELYVVYCKV